MSQRHPRWSVCYISAEDSELGAMSVKEFCEKYRIGTTKFYEEVKAGRLRAVKCGSPNAGPQSR